MRRRGVFVGVFEDHALPVTTDKTRREMHQMTQSGQLAREGDHVADTGNIDGLEQRRRRRRRLQRREVKDVGDVGEAADLEASETQIHLANVATDHAHPHPFRDGQAREVGFGVGATTLFNEAHDSDTGPFVEQTPYKPLADEARIAGHERS